MDVALYEYSDMAYLKGEQNDFGHKLFAALGFRNPFRFTIRPAHPATRTAKHPGVPGTIYVGDVGANDWEELSVVKSGGLNFGWPEALVLEA